MMMMMLYITIVFRIFINNLFCFYYNAILLYHDLDGNIP